MLGKAVKAVRERRKRRRLHPGVRVKRMGVGGSARTGVYRGEREGKAVLMMVGGDELAPFDEVEIIKEQRSR